MLPSFSTTRTKATQMIPTITTVAFMMILAVKSLTFTPNIFTIKSS